MTTHELAKQLLEMPDVEVWGDSVGQLSAEGEDESLKAVKMSMDGSKAWLAFFPIELNPNWGK